MDEARLNYLEAGTIYNGLRVGLNKYESQEVIAEVRKLWDEIKRLDRIIKEKKSATND
jgi:hypothetical protein